MNYDTNDNPAEHDCAAIEERLSYERHRRKELETECAALRHQRNSLLRQLDGALSAYSRAAAESDRAYAELLTMHQVNACQTDLKTAEDKAALADIVQAAKERLAIPGAAAAADHGAWVARAILAKLPRCMALIDREPNIRCGNRAKFVIGSAEFLRCAEHANDDVLGDARSVVPWYDALLEAEHRAESDDAHPAPYGHVSRANPDVDLDDLVSLRENNPFVVDASVALRDLPPETPETAECKLCRAVAYHVSPQCPIHGTTRESR